MNSLAKTDPANSTALTTYDPADPYAAYADAVSPHMIVGKLLKFSKGDFFAGENNERIAQQTQFTANLDELMVGWVKWRLSKPIEQIMRRVTDPRTLPKRGELGDDDENQWEVASNGDPRDPWQFTNYLPLMNEAGELFTFVASSRGGLNAVGDLCRRYSTIRRKYPDDHVIVELNVDSYQHAKREYGRIKFPILTIVGRSEKSKFAEALQSAGMMPGGEPAAPGAQPGIALDDEIPF